MVFIGCLMWAVCWYFFFNSSHPPNPESLNLAVKPNSLYSLNLTTFENKKNLSKNTNSGVRI